MRIGLDFDNTIVNYDNIFHTVALEQAVIPKDLPANKLAIRDYLRSIDQEEVWTEMQGTVYGARMNEAEAYPGVLEFIKQAKVAGHTLAIVSHKTKTTFRGPQYDLHAAARGWIERYLVEEGVSLIPENQIYFELTRDEKLARIADFGCEVFIDDLPEVLLAATFPTTTQRILFDPQGHHQDKHPELKIFSIWETLISLLSPPSACSLRVGEGQGGG